MIMDDIGELLNQFETPETEEEYHTGLRLACIRLAIDFSAGKTVGLPVILHSAEGFYGFALGPDKKSGTE